MPGSWHAGYESEQSEAWLSDILMYAAMTGSSIRKTIFVFRGN